MKIGIEDIPLSKKGSFIEGEVPRFSMEKNFFGKLMRYVNLSTSIMNCVIKPLLKVKEMVQSLENNKNIAYVKLLILFFPFLLSILLISALIGLKIFIPNLVLVISWVVMFIFIFLREESKKYLEKYILNFLCILDFGNNCKEEIYSSLIQLIGKVISLDKLGALAVYEIAIVCCTIFFVSMISGLPTIYYFFFITGTTLLFMVISLEVTNKLIYYYENNLITRFLNENQYVQTNLFLFHDLYRRYRASIIPFIFIFSLLISVILCFYPLKMIKCFIHIIFCCFFKLFQDIIYLFLFAQISLIVVIISALCLGYPLSIF